MDTRQKLTLSCLILFIVSCLLLSMLSLVIASLLLINRSAISHVPPLHLTLAPAALLNPILPGPLLAAIAIP